MPETNFFWDPLSDNILQERDETGAVTAEYTTEPGLYGNLVSQNRAGVESQHHFDAQGSTLALTDDNQQVTDTYAYTAFGEVTEQGGNTVNPFQYTGQKGYYRDEVTAGYYMRRMAISPTHGVWLSRIVSGDVTHLQSYAYDFPIRSALMIAAASLNQPGKRGQLITEPTAFHCWNCTGFYVYWDIRVPDQTRNIPYMVVQHITVSYFELECDADKTKPTDCAGRHPCKRTTRHDCSFSVYEFLGFIFFERVAGLLVPIKDDQSAADTWGRRGYGGRCYGIGNLRISADVRAFVFDDKHSPYSDLAMQDPWRWGKRSCKNTTRFDFDPSPHLDCTFGQNIVTTPRGVPASG